MFTKIHVENYRSLINLDFDLTYKQGKMKPLAIIYGENGVGKSNIATLFYTLCESLKTMSIRNTLQQILDNRSDLDKNVDESFEIVNKLEKEKFYELFAKEFKGDRINNKKL